MDPGRRRCFRRPNDVARAHLVDLREEGAEACRRCASSSGRASLDRSPAVQGLGGDETATNARHRRLLPADTGSQPMGLLVDGDSPPISRVFQQ